MELKDICIYSYIKDYLDEIPIVKYKKGEYITHSDENLEEIFFVLEGNVKIEIVTKCGKSFLVDTLSENEFVGKISYIYEQNLFCDITSTSNSSLLKINKNIFRKLQQNSEFLNIFFYKTSKRMYYMYKKLMMKDLFRLEELLAFYILKNSQEDIFKYNSMYGICKTLSVSRKNLYNTINKFIEKGCIKKDENSITILDKNYLYELSTYVREFNKKDTHGFKFDI